VRSLTPETRGHSVSEHSSTLLSVGYQNPELKCDAARRMNDDERVITRVCIAIKSDPRFMAPLCELYCNGPFHVNVIKLGRQYKTVVYVQQGHNLHIAWRWWYARGCAEAW
jgi:hypothetical protein